MYLKQSSHEFKPLKLLSIAIYAKKFFAIEYLALNKTTISVGEIRLINRAFVVIIA